MKLIEYMEHHGITPVSMAHFVGTTPTTIYAITKHGSKPRQKLSERIEKYTLGVVTVKELRGRDARKPRKGLGQRREDCDNTPRHIGKRLRSAKKRPIILEKKRRDTYASVLAKHRQLSAK